MVLLRLLVFLFVTGATVMCFERGQGEVRDGLLNATPPPSPCVPVRPCVWKQVKEAARQEARQKSHIFAQQRETEGATKDNDPSIALDYPGENQWSCTGIDPGEKIDTGAGSDGSGDPHGGRDGRASGLGTEAPGLGRGEEEGREKKCSCGLTARSIRICRVRPGVCSLGRSCGPCVLRTCR